jgi:spore coat polysaccharide biosynthesis protein SpsF (cytidylyltransferase family)
MSALAIVQARMSSTRLPGKVLAGVAGEPMLALLLRRLSHARLVGEIRVATSVLGDDDPIEAAAGALGVAVHRGSLDDVLERFVDASAGHDGPIVRITADCPFVDAGIVDDVIALYEHTPGCAYASNVSRRTHPDGLDVEVVAKAALLDAHRETTDPVAREHVTADVREHADRWPAAELVHEPEDLGELRWTVDTPDDLAFVRAVAAALGARLHEARMDEILAIVRADPKLASMPGGRRA